MAACEKCGMDHPPEIMIYPDRFYLVDLNAGPGTVRTIVLYKGLHADTGNAVFEGYEGATAELGVDAMHVIREVQGG